VKNTVIVGAQFGDEGKAKITDILADKADFIIRYQGGCNAGHTVVANGQTYKFHLIPSGLLYENKTCFIGPGVVIHPDSFEKELNDLVEQGVSREHIEKTLRICPLAHITMPYHIDIDRYSEDMLEDVTKIGTTKKGIGPTYADKFNRLGIKVEDLFSPETLDKKLDTTLAVKNRELSGSFGQKPYSKQLLLMLCKEYKKLLEPFVSFGWQDVLRDAKKGKTILFEGAQGVLLDVDYGTYPYVTSSNPIGGGAAVGSGMGPLSIQEVLGVFKAYMTRVGEGPFITELNDETGDEIRKIGTEFGVTTGRPRRCGYFDAVMAKYSVLAGGLSSAAITKLDIFDSFDEVKVCTAYRNKKTDEVVTYYPTNVYVHSDYEPIYESFPGWKTDITGCKTYNELPENARKYIEKLEGILEIPVSIVGVGPGREQVIFRQA